MTTIINRTTTRKEFAALLKKSKRRRRKGVDVKSFSGKLKLEEDPLTIQRTMRDGWK
jgi:hypothetical protein